MNKSLKFVVCSGMFVMALALIAAIPVPQRALAEVQASQAKSVTEAPTPTPDSKLVKIPIQKSELDSIFGGDWSVVSTTTKTDAPNVAKFYMVNYGRTEPDFDMFFNKISVFNDETSAKQFFQTEFSEGESLDFGDEGKVSAKTIGRLQTVSIAWRNKDTCVSFDYVGMTPIKEVDTLRAIILIDGRLSGKPGSPPEPTSQPTKGPGGICGAPAAIMAVGLVFLTNSKRRSKHK